MTEVLMQAKASASLHSNSPNLQNNSSSPEVPKEPIKSKVVLHGTSTGMVVLAPGYFKRPSHSASSNQFLINGFINIKQC